MSVKIILTEEDSITTALTTVGIDAIKDELKKNVDFSKGLTITDLEDKNQFKVVKDTKNGYVKTRKTIERAFKSKRDDYNKLASDNLIAQREVIGVIETEENRLNDLVKKAELEKLKKDNVLVLLDRKEALKKCECVIEDNLLLVMKEKDFEELLTNKRFEFIEIEKARIKADKEKLEREKELEKVKKQAKLEAEQEAERQAEITKQKVEQEKREAKQKLARAKEIKKEQIEALKRKTIKEKEESIRQQKDELERVENEKKAEIERIRKEQQDKELKEKQAKSDEESRVQEEKAKKEAEQELLAKRQEFIQYRDSLDFDHFEDKDGKRIFYKKVGEFNI